MATTEIRAFATSNSGNNQPLNTFLANATLLGNGWADGEIPLAKDMNRVLRQISFITKGLADIIVDAGLNQPDDGNLTTLKSNFLAAIYKSPPLTGVPTCPTAAASTATTQVASTAFVTAADNLKANINSPHFTGVPWSDYTPSAGDVSGSLANTAFVTVADNLKANIDSPTFTGTPSAPTPATGTRSTRLATTQMFLDEFQSSNAPNGFFRLPNGLIVQWWGVQLPRQTNQIIEFPIAFPNTIWHIVGNVGASVPTNGADTICVEPYSLAGCRVTTQSQTVGGVNGCHFVAIGS